MTMAQQQRTVTKPRAENMQRLSFAVHASLLGGFVGLVGFVAIACHHLAH